MQKKYKTLVLIGRFQPLHNAHLKIIQQASEIAEQLVIITGSAKQARTYKNPFTSQEREDMIVDATSGKVNGMSVYVESNIDTIYNNQAWAIRIQGIVSKYAVQGTATGIIGYKKDESSFYFDMFPQWDFVNVGLVEPLSAVDIRDLYFKRDVNMNFIKSVVPQSTFEFLSKFKETAEYEQVIREREFVQNYKKQFASLPYQPIFSTADAVVIQSGHVLMIKRRSEPGKGLWALPGGFVNASTDASVQDAAIRELREETGLKVPAPVLRGSITANKVFDAIDRSARGRTITHAFKFELQDGELPKVKGMDDAEKAKWIPFAEIKSEECFEDHYEIISHFIGG